MEAVCSDMMWPLWEILADLWNLDEFDLESTSPDQRLGRVCVNTVAAVARQRLRLSMLQSSNRLLFSL
jgi:hypothetical protein